MINSINSNTTSMSMPPQRSRSEQSLTDTQTNLISETLSNYDVDNLSESDAATIVSLFAENGIQPGAALEEAVASAGFDAKSIGELAGVAEEGNRPPPPPPPQQSAEEISTMVDYLSELMEEKMATNNNTALSDEDKQSILAQVFEKFDIDSGDSIINTTA